VAFSPYNECEVDKKRCQIMLKVIPGRTKYELTLSNEEVAALYIVLQCVGGDYQKSPRKYLEKLCDSLEEINGISSFDPMDYVCEDHNEVRFESDCIENFHDEVNAWLP
jgi:hypothetical protein